MMKSAAALALVATSLAASEGEYRSEFTNWMIQHDRSYEHEEFQARFNIFKANYDFVQNFDGQHTVALNEFADLTNEEFVAMYTGLNLVVSEDDLIVDDEPVSPEIPTSVNWKTAGAVTHVKNQGQCGSCWSFSTTGSVEGCHEIATGTLTSFSEQNLVDCSTAEGNMGCNGGLMDDAFKYIISNKGLDTEASYPYTATGPNQCQYSAANSGGYITGYTDIPSGSESSLTNAIVNTPVSVAIDASHSSFQFYQSGVYYEPACSSTQLDHGVLAVGYGVDSGTDYYQVKNSWGSSWGMEGYIWMSRNRDNNCGIATAASYPTGCVNP
jgi:cathepsin L